MRSGVLLWPKSAAWQSPLDLLSFKTFKTQQNCKKQHISTTHGSQDILVAY
jgi:hypothetical protein